MVIDPLAQAIDLFIVEVFVQAFVGCRSEVLSLERMKIFDLQSLWRIG
jgi:hypothetical protein